MKQSYVRLAKEEQKCSEGKNTPPLAESFSAAVCRSDERRPNALASANDELHRMGRDKAGAGTITEGQEISCVGNRRPANLRTYQ